MLGQSIESCKNVLCCLNITCAGVKVWNATFATYNTKAEMK